MPSNTNQSAESAIDTSHSEIDHRLNNHFSPAPVVFVIHRMRQAVGLQCKTGGGDPRVLPWAGMKQAFGLGV